MKKNWLTILILFLLTANIALLLTLLIRNNNSEPFLRHRIHDRKIEHFDNERGDFEMHIANKLQMDDKQREQLNAFSQEFHKQKQELKDKMFSIKGRYFENLATENINVELLESMADSLGMLHAAMIKLDHQHYKNLKSICTAKQAIQLDSLGRIHINKRMGNNWSDEKRRHEKSGNNCRNNN